MINNCNTVYVITVFFYCVIYGRILAYLTVNILLMCNGTNVSIINVCETVTLNMANVLILCLLLVL